MFSDHLDYIANFSYSKSSLILTPKKGLRMLKFVFAQPFSILNYEIDCLSNLTFFKGAVSLHWFAKVNKTSGWRFAKITKLLLQKNANSVMKQFDTTNLQNDTTIYKFVAPSKLSKAVEEL